MNIIFAAQRSLLKFSYNYEMIQVKKTITLQDKAFQVYIEEEEILARVKAIAKEINSLGYGEIPLIVPVLNGAFMFAADLLKNIERDVEISFVKVASYVGMQSTGEVEEILGFQEELAGRRVILVEDIVDTGQTISGLLSAIKEFKPKEVKVATLLHKPNAMQVNVPLDYVGFEIADDFVVGYGLDYNGLGRNLKDIYKVVE